MRVTIIIPTYNERDNIGNTLDRLLPILKTVKGHQFNVLIVDDNSPDGTQDVVRKYRDKYKNIFLITGTKNGLGVAYARGMKYAMKELKADVVFEMDADGQHDPKYIPEFMKQIDAGYDYVLGSRYIPGGSVPKEWGIHRKFISYFGSLFARIILGTPEVKDYTGGYKASRVKGYLDSIDLDHLLSKRYAYKIDLLYKMLRRGAKVKEIPIQFKNREKDKSKSTLEDLFDSFNVVMKLRFNNR